MARGDEDPSENEDGRILSPEELDISNDEHVAEIDDGRYVVSPNEPIEDLPGTESDETPSSADTRSHPPGSRSREPLPDQSDSQSSRDPGSGPVADSGKRGGEVTEEAVRTWLTDRLDGSDSRYGFDVTAKFDGSVRRREMVSNDVVTIFESLVLWYAQQIDSTTPVEEVLGILLTEANVPIKYPSASVQALLESTDLSPDDSIEDLVEAVDADDGFRL